MRPNRKAPKSPTRLKANYMARSKIYLRNQAKIKASQSLVTELHPLTAKRIKSSFLSKRKSLARTSSPNEPERLDEQSLIDVQR